MAHVLLQNRFLLRIADGRRVNLVWQNVHNTVMEVLRKILRHLILQVCNESFLSIVS